MHFIQNHNFTGFPALLPKTSLDLINKHRLTCDDTFNQQNQKLREYYPGSIQLYLIWKTISRISETDISEVQWSKILFTS